MCVRRRFKLVVMLFLSLWFGPSQGQTDCLDKNALCAMWSGRGVCTTQQNFMSEHCPKTCGFCNSGTTSATFPRLTIRNPEFVCGRFGEGVSLSRQKRQFGGVLDGIGGILDSFRPNPGSSNISPSRPNINIGPIFPNFNPTQSNPSPIRPNFPARPISNPFQPTNVASSLITNVIPVLSPITNPVISIISSASRLLPTLISSTFTSTTIATAVGGGKFAVTPGVGIVVPVNTGPIPRPRPTPVIPANPPSGPTTNIQRPNPTPNPARLTKNPVDKIPQVTPEQGVRLEDAICGSAPITDRFLLSAAHCFPNPEKKFRVIVGDLDLSKQGEANSRPQNVDIERIFIHPDYRHSTGIRYNDIALLKTEQRIEFSHLVYPLCILPRPTDLSGAPLTVSGFGFVNATHRSPVLQEAVLEGINAANCETRYRNEDYEIVLRVTYPELLIGKGLLCAAAPGKDACEGDSGGPLTIRDVTGRNYLIGIVSVGAPCTGNSFSILPGLYTDVAHYADWIDSVIYGV